MDSYYTYYKKPVTRDINFKNLSFFSNILIDNNIEHCITWGTLLSFIRDGDLFDEDDDIDFSINSKDFNAVRQLTRKHNLVSIIPTSVPIWGKVHIEDPRHSLLQCMIQDDDVRSFVDLYPYEDNGNDYVVDYWQGEKLSIEEKIKRKTALHLPKDLLFPFKEVNFNGIKIKIPNKPEEFMEYGYGEHWKEKLEKGKDYSWSVVNNKPKVILSKS